MTDIFVRQIYYDAESKAALDPQFIPLDNSGNERPDWREYHPIRKFLLTHKLEDNCYYGFFSPRFESKTKLTSTEVVDFVRQNAGVDAVLFCPHFDQSAFFLNVFEQGELHHKGLAQASEALFKAIGIDVDIKTLVNDSTNTIFANYFIARPNFWAHWFQAAERMYERCELSSHDVSQLLSPTTHRFAKEIELKVFVMERLATLLLSTSADYRTAVYDPTMLPMPGSVLMPFLRQMVLCDALKMAYRRLKNRTYLLEFLELRNYVLSASANLAQTPQARPGRNELCYCGSGRKYKHCHGRTGG